MTCPTCGRGEDTRPMNDTELRAALGVGEAKFYAMKKAGQLRMFEVKRPLGQRRYARAKVAQYLAGESIAAFGRRA